MKNEGKFIKKPIPLSILTSKMGQTINSTIQTMPLSTKSEPIISDKKNNLENWFKALIKCREKRKVEMKISAHFSYILYAVVTKQVNKNIGKTQADISDGIVMCELLNSIYPNKIAYLEKCESREDKIRNLSKYCDFCLYFSGFLFV